VRPWVDHLREDWDGAGLRLWKGVIDPVARSWERQFAETASGLFGEEKRGLIEALRPGKASIIDWVAIELTIKEVLESREGDWRAGFIPLFQGLSEEWADEWSVQLGVDFALTQQEVLDFVEDYSFKFVERHQGVTRDGVARLVAQAAEEGWGILELIGSGREGTGLQGLVRRMVVPAGGDDRPDGDDPKRKRGRPGSVRGRGGPAGAVVDGAGRSGVRVLRGVAREDVDDGRCTVQARGRVSSRTVGAAAELRGCPVSAVARVLQVYVATSGSVRKSSSVKEANDVQ